MSQLAEIYLRVTVTDATGIVINREFPPVRFTPASGLPKQETASLTGSSFTALSPPSGAKGLLIQVGTATSLTLKSITGDNGIPITAASNPIGADLFITLTGSPSIGILNGNSSTQSVTCLWL